jgi:hypothetical protein
MLESSESSSSSLPIKTHIPYPVGFLGVFIVALLHVLHRPFPRSLPVGLATCTSHFSAFLLFCVLPPFLGLLTICPCLRSLKNTCSIVRSQLVYRFPHFFFRFQKFIKIVDLSPECPSSCLSKGELHAALP